MGIFPINEIGFVFTGTVKAWQQALEASPGQIKLAIIQQIVRELPYIFSDGSEELDEQVVSFAIEHLQQKRPVILDKVAKLIADEFRIAFQEAAKAPGKRQRKLQETR